MSDRPALGILEIEHIARGMLVADAVVKRAVVDILKSAPVSGGKHLIFLRGSVAEIEESMKAGREVAGSSLSDSLLLPMLHEQVWRLLPERVWATDWADDDEAESVAIVETTGVCAAVQCADAAAKVADVTLRDMQLAVGISGKGFFTMTGRLFDIEAAVAAARDAAGNRLLLVETIARPAVEIRGQLIKP